MAVSHEREIDVKELAKLAEIEKSEEALAALVRDLSSSSRRARQFAARVASLVAQREPEMLAPYLSDLIEVLERPEAQTRWEVLDALALLVPAHADELGDAYEGAEAALFDELSSTLHYSAFNMLCTWGATSEERSSEVWPVIDEAIQCYHGDIEYRDMLGCLHDFAEGAITRDVAASLAERLHFDAENGKGSYLKVRSCEIYDLLVARFGLEPPKKKARAKKADDIEDDEE